MPSKYIMRLDDACEYTDRAKWQRMEHLLDSFGVKPLVAVIPKCKDPDFLSYPINPDFPLQVKKWISKDWTVAMHGYTHEHPMDDGGLSPVNRRSEFAGLPLEEQKNMVTKGVFAMKTLGVDPQVFVAPLHTFDRNTIEALKQESSIRIISDTIATQPYTRWGMTFVPQQSGKARALPLPLVTFCYHPNIMSDEDFVHLEDFLDKHHQKFISFPLEQTTRKRTLLDKSLATLYLLRRRVVFG